MTKSKDIRSNELSIQSISTHPTNRVIVRQLLLVVIGCGCGTVVYFVLEALLRKSLGIEHWLGHLLLSQINLASMAVFFAAILILIQVFRCNRKKTALIQLSKCLQACGEVFIREDAAVLKRHLAETDDLTRRSAVGRLFDAALARARISWSPDDITNAIDSCSEILYSECEYRLTLPKYAVWSIPSIGFLGTIYGIGQAMGALDIGGSTGGGSNLSLATSALNVAFDTTLVALVLSLVLVLVLQLAQTGSESVVTQARDWCLSNFVSRMRLTGDEEAA